MRLYLISFRYAVAAPKFAANGRGKTREECLANLGEAIALILEHRREESLRSLPPDAAQELVVG
jgi:predicted RNase H-like HicB family nuclease